MSSGFKHVKVQNICKFSLIWQGSECVSGCNYASVLNTPGSQVFQVSAYASVAQGSEYAWIWLYNALSQGPEYAWSTFQGFKNASGSKYTRVQNIIRLWICGGYTLCWCLNNPEYALIMSHMCEYTSITLNMIEYVGIFLDILETAF